MKCFVPSERAGIQRATTAIKTDNMIVVTYPR